MSSEPITRSGRTRSGPRSANAARETLRMGDVVEVMLRQAMTALMTNDRALVREVSRMDDVVDKLDEAIKLYVTKLTRGSLDEREGHRAMEIISFTINLEHIGDIIDNSMMEMAMKKIRNQDTFSRQGFAEISAMHALVMENMQLAHNVFMTGDITMARKIFEAKEMMRSQEKRAEQSDAV